jgi:polyisoprenoid-binding protein YceI
MRCVAILALLSATLPALAAEDLTIDSSHSAVIFSWSHFGFSNPVARLEKMEGNLLLDPTDLARSSVTVVLPLAGLRSGDERLDRRLKTDEFLDATRYPEIRFRSTRVETMADGMLKVTGDLSVHGVTKTVILNAKVDRIGLNPISKAPTAGFDAEAVIRRSDFGVSKYVPAMTDELHVHITLAADLRQH